MTFYRSSFISSDGGGYSYRVGEDHFLQVRNTANMKDLKVNANGDLVVEWSWKSTDPTKEISMREIEFRIYPKTIFAEEIQEGNTYDIDNTVTADLKYYYSDDQIITDTETVTIETVAGKLELNKDSEPYSRGYYGEDRTYTITASNPEAVSYNGLGYLHDIIPAYMYIKPENLEKMFAEDAARDPSDIPYGLEVMIGKVQAGSSKGATLTAPITQREVIGTDGEIAGVTAVQNTGADTTYSGIETVDSSLVEYGSTLKLFFGADRKIHLKVIHTDASEEEYVIGEGEDFPSIAAAFEAIGYIVTGNDEYQVRWHFPENYSLPGGYTHTRKIYSTVMDSFMAIGSDTWHRWAQSELSTLNAVYAYKYGEDGAPDTMIKQFRPNSYYVHERDFRLDKGVYLDDEEITETNEITDGSVIRYELHIEHNGNAFYDILPLTDHMTGVQILMAEADANAGKDWTAGLSTTTYKDKEYYLLDRPGTYTNVSVNGHVADTVKVTSQGSGLDTLIYFYLNDFTGTQTKIVDYMSYIAPTQLAPGSRDFNFDNESWLNDHETHRLYDAITLGGTVLKFNKRIVDPSDIEATIKEEGEVHSVVYSGDSVTYRLFLRQSGFAESITLTGSDFYDQLPYSVYRDPDIPYKWDESNIDIVYQGFTNDAELNSLDTTWYIDDTGIENGGYQQYLRFDPNQDFEVSGDCYIYVTIRFPGRTDQAENEAWEEYLKTFGSPGLMNRFFVDNIPSVVTHELGEPPKVRLQKGVYNTGVYYKTGAYSRWEHKSNTDSTSNIYYINDDEGLRYVSYYVALQNDGYTNLYLNDMEDILPKGFTFLTLTNSNNVPTDMTKLDSSINTTSGAIQYITMNSENKTYAYKAMNITAVTSGDPSQGQHITFKIDKPTTNSDYACSYSNLHKKYYLAPGEAIVFRYLARTNSFKDSEAYAPNEIVMPYYNTNGLDVQISDNALRAYYVYEDPRVPNNGDCDLITASEAGLKGYNTSSGDEEYLSSSVTVSRGNIAPGITKRLTAKKLAISGTEVPYPASAAPNDTLIWTIDADNDGAYQIIDYAISDVAQKPYRFVGDVHYEVWKEQLIDQPNNVWGNVNSTFGSQLFTIVRDPVNEDAVTIKVRNESHPLTVGGDAIELQNYWYTRGDAVSIPESFYVSMSRDENGNEVLSVRIPSERMAIPAGGSGKLKVQTENKTAALMNKVYVNTAFLSPLQQTWSYRTNKGNVTEFDTPYQDGKTMSVRNSAPVNVAYGYATTAQKGVTEAELSEDGTENRAVTNNHSTTEEYKNYIGLSDVDSGFVYDIKVDNTTHKPMSKLTIIDNLPEVDDHNPYVDEDVRGSLFKVLFLRNPDIKVKVELNTEEEYVDGAQYYDIVDGEYYLKSEYYDLDFSSKTEFTDDDWDGLNTNNDWAPWEDGFESTKRSLRVNIKNGYELPAKGKITIFFNCRIDPQYQQTVEPGEIAWNSFGYNYRLQNEGIALGAVSLKVGVKTPEVPYLKKMLIYSSDDPYIAPQDETFRYVIYKGEAITLPAQWNEDTLGEILTSENRDFTLAEVTVPEGQSESVGIALKNLKKYTYTSANGFEEGADNFLWQNGYRFSLIELPKEGYDFKSFNNLPKTSFTFFYNGSDPIEIESRNTVKDWEAELTKVDSEDPEKKLKNAYFALYTTDKYEEISDETYNALFSKPERRFVRNNALWYLKEVVKTNENGIINFIDLSVDKYLYQEIWAPPGYFIDEEIYEIERPVETATRKLSFTVTNEALYELPSAGGPGTYLFTIIGTMLIMFGIIYVYDKQFRYRKKHQ